MPGSTAKSGHNDQGMEPIAIVGMSCTLAGGVDRPGKLWETLLKKEIKQSAKIPESRFNIDAYFHDDAYGRPSSIGSKGGFFLDTELHTFDAEFFGYEADEAKHMDPQHFRVLESVYECLESAGRTLEDVKGTNTAVYIGNFSLDQVIKSSRNSYDDRHLHEVIGVDPGLMSSRVSYVYDMNGPVYTTNTGCTSSLYALHTAAMALRGRECGAAIVGGCNLLQGPEAYSSYTKFGIMSPDSRCHAFDARCNGYVRAEGVGTLYVRRLSDAIRDNDPIRGVIRSIAVNANGFVPGMPLFVPNQQGLEKAMQLAYTQANLDPYDTAYVETHGIGMVLGEIAEAHAVGKFMNEPRRRETPLPVGALKANFGHQEAGSGIFILIKAAMMTESGIIPAHADFQSAHPAIDLEKLNIKPQAENSPWPEGYSVRRVGMNSYGWSGTNAHLLVEDVQNLNPGYSGMAHRRETGKQNRTVKRPLLVTFSAFGKDSLLRNIANLATVADEYYLADLAYTLNTRRSKFKHRSFVVASDGKAAEAFKSVAQSAVIPEQRPTVSVTFGDDAADLLSLASELYEVYPDFKESISKTDAILEELHMGTRVADIIAGNVETPSGTNSSVCNTTIQIALVNLLKFWNIDLSTPNSGNPNEIVAAYSVGRLSDREALQALSDRPAPNIALQVGTGGSSKIQVTSLNTLLEAVGQLYLGGIPVDLDKVNAIKADWKPLLVVDLPPYEWDHSRTYSSESHANREHRVNKHAYHDLLGRRVFGLGPQTMVWKNKLSFRDLPKTIPPVPNLKPETVVGLDQFVEMAAEALAQAFEGTPIQEFTLQELVLSEELKYAEDVDQIELQTSIAKIPGAQNSYGLGIQSVRDGKWTNHCEGRISMNDGIQRNIVKSQDSNVQTQNEWTHAQLQRSGVAMGAA